MATTMFVANLKRSLSLKSKLLLSRSFCCCVKNVSYRKNLASRIIPLGKPSISLVPVLDQWVREGNAVNDSVLRTIIKTLSNRSRFHQALQVSEWMRSKGLCPFSPGDEAVQLNLVGRVRGLSFAESYFHDLSDGDKTEKHYGALLNCYVREGLLDKSLSLMHKMKELGYVSTLYYNNIMSLYMQTDQHEKIPEVLTQMKENGLLPDKFSYRICLTFYGTRSDLVNLEKLLKVMERQGDIFQDWETYSMVANFFIKAGEKEKALIYLKKCEDKVGSKSLAYSHLISHYATLGDKEAVMRLWNLQKTKCKKQVNRDYITMLGSLVKLGVLEEAERLLLDEWQSSGNYYDFRVPNVVLIGYTKKGMIENAERMLKCLVGLGNSPTPNSWAIIAAGYVAKQEMEKAFQCLKKAVAVRSENEGWRPKHDIISSILSWISDNKDFDEVEEFVNSLKLVIPMDRNMYLSLIKVHVRCGKDLNRILKSMKADEIVIDEEVENILSSSKGQ